MLAPFPNGQPPTRPEYLLDVASGLATFASVIVPTRGRPAALRRAIDSVRAQDTDDWELIVADDGGGDGIATAESYRDPRISGIANAGRGQADARITAVSHARGELVCWLDDDDWWADPAHLSQLRRRSAGESGFAYRGGCIVFEHGGAEVSREPFDHDATPESMRVNNTVLTSSLAYPRELHRELGLLDRELGSYADWDWMLRVLDAGHAPYKLDGLGVCYSIHESNVSGAYDAPERKRYFERFAAKHRLDIKLANHLRIHRELSSG
jgi:glycosyltransferase involved in cell wall biosynthesis